MNVIAWFAFFNVITAMLLILACWEMRNSLIALEDQNLEYYKRTREIITECLKLREVTKHELDKH
jgi:hypothetical protein